MVTVKSILILCLAFGLTAATEERRKRQAYDGNYNGAAQYRQPQGYQQQQPQSYQQQPQGYQQQSYGHQPASQQYAPQQAHKPARPQGGAPQEEEKEQGPHPLNLLLENSKFECGSKSDGYYADSGVGCQAFHYCVSGHKHSMMCPAGTVFHQVHLNCVPQDQDICNKADKFYFVNDYLNKQLEQKGPNDTVQWAHRYYPDNYAVGDPFVPPQETQKQPPAATYGLGPAYREQQPAPAPHQGAYHPQAAYAQQAPAHHQQPAAPVHHAHNPAPYAPPAQTYQHRPAQAAAQAYQHRPAQPAQQQYGYGAQQAQAYNLQAQQAQRAYAQQQHQAVAPQQHLYGAGAGQRPRYA